MSRLGTGSSQHSDWSQSTGFYSRLTIASSAHLSRPEDHFPPAPTNTNTVHPNLFPGRRILRTEMLDLGHCDHQFELGNFDQYCPLRLLTIILNWYFSWPVEYRLRSCQRRRFILCPREAQFPHHLATSSSWGAIAFSCSQPFFGFVCNNSRMGVGS